MPPDEISPARPMLAVATGGYGHVSRTHDRTRARNGEMWPSVGPLASADDGAIARRFCSRLKLWPQLAPPADMATRDAVGRST